MRAYPSALIKFSIITVLLLAFNECIGQQRRIDSLNTLLSVETEPKNRIKVLCDLGDLYLSTNPDTAITILRKALAFSVQTNNNSGKCRSNELIGRCYQMKEKYTQAIPYHEKVLHICDSLLVAKESGMTENAILKWKSNPLNSLGIAYRSLGEYVKALEYYLKALEIKEKIGDEILNTTLNIGTIYMDFQDYDKALTYFHNAVELAEGVGNNQTLANGYANIGAVYNLQNNLEKAIEYYLKSLAITEKHDYVRTTTTILSNLGTCYNGLEDYDKALDCFTRSLKIAEKTNDELGKASALTNIGTAYRYKKDYVEAEAYLLQALKIYDTLEAIAPYGQAQKLLSVIYEEAGKYKEALLHYQESMYVRQHLYTAEKNNELNSMALTYEFEKKQAAQAAEQEKRDLIALTEIEKQKAFSQSMVLRHAFERQQAEQTAEKEKNDLITQNEIQKQADINKRMTLTFEFEKKQAEQATELEKKEIIAKEEIAKQKTIRNSSIAVGSILVLASLVSLIFYRRRRDAQVKLKESELRKMETSSSLRLKESEMKVLYSQFHSHFNGNALQSIRDFLQKHEPLEAEKYLLKFSRLMQLMLNHSGKKEITLSEELETLSIYTELENLRMTHPFHYKVNLDMNIDSNAVYIPPNIIQPIVENAIKHGLLPKPSNGNIKLDISPENGQLRIDVEDNGIGRIDKKNRTESLFMRPSNGTRITEERVRLVNEQAGTKPLFEIIDLTHEGQAEGTKVTIKIPLMYD